MVAVTLLDQSLEEKHRGQISKFDISTGKQFVRGKAGRTWLATRENRTWSHLLPYMQQRPMIWSRADGKHLSIHADVTSVEFVEQLMTHVSEAYSAPPSILVNNAGIIMDKSLLKMTSEQWDWVLATNLKGPFILSQAFCKAAVQHGLKGASIVNISSIVGKTGNFGQANYASAKAGLIGLTKTVAKEMGPKGIRCNAVLPGFIETSMTAKLPDAVLSPVLALTPLGRLGQPEDIANACVFLGSDLSTFVTGACLEVTGGLAM